MIKDYFQIDMTLPQVNAISNLGLAHMGDGVFELLCRSYLCCRGDVTVDRLHHDTVQLVKAPAQARFAEVLVPLLSEEELTLYRRGKNAHVHAVPKGATPLEYAKATGVEALFGALYLMGRRERVNDLFCQVMEVLHGV